MLQKKILYWYKNNGRKDLPWKTTDIYKVWISEIMLQQTQVKTVIPFYNKFIGKFPNLEKLSNASLDDILKLWSGLGFYKRAENIYKSSQYIKKNHNNKFPVKYEDLINLPGIGRTTASAILTFSKNGKFPILDGNVKRFLSRLYYIDSKLPVRDIENKLWKLSENLLPNKKTPEFIQSLMDIGSLICKKSEPLCLKCPVSHDCFSYKKNNIKKINFKKKVSLKKENIWTVLIIDNQERIFLTKLSYKNLWKGLYSSPIFPDKHHMSKWINQHNLQNYLSSTIWKFSHKLSHINFLFNVHICKIISDKKVSLMGDNWYNLSNIKFGTPKYQDRIITEYINNYD